MSKITFRADDDLVEQLEALEVSKSEAMREALRAYLGESSEEASDECVEREASDTTIDDLVRERVDDLLGERLGDPRRQPRTHTPETQDVNVTISLEGVDGQVSDDARVREPSAVDDRTTTTDRSRADADVTRCNQCGEHVAGEHVYCPNCGEKTSRRLFCECGDELRSDWAFCPSCGRRTPAADVLESDSRSSRPS
ncbi:double zinc ribbon domain-containing protein [Halopiger goleimassiliensis]|uniref:double zinc ribbon domain-containing protein n=1 Tax=Halopiger goleimassiliensis TaxID=1293048 RepID=UPI0006779F58|nr:zinc ribbon domain-containing protein [Halopiger goleimassiliensis]